VRTTERRRLTRCSRAACCEPASGFRCPGQPSNRNGSRQRIRRMAAGQVRQSGIEPSHEIFTLSRVDPQLAYARLANRRIDGVPMFDATFTSAEGVSGRLGPLGSDADIGLAETSPVNVTHTAEADIIPAARQSRHKAVILVTGATRPGLFLSNAPRFLNPAGPPMLQVSNVESAWLKQQ